MSSFFKLSKGVRQGCPISALLFLLVVEVVAIILRHSEELTGIIVGKTEIRLCMFADDMTMFLYNLESVKVVMEIFEEFYRYAGLKLNKKKTEALALQSIDCTPNNLFGIKWIDCPFKTLGFWFSINYDEMFQLNTNEKMKTMQNTINSWSSRCLTIKGKITVLKSLIVPHLQQLASVFPLNDTFIAHIEKIIFNFVWSNRKHLVSKEVLILPVPLGGLKMISTKAIINTARITFVKRLLNNINAKWKFLAHELMGFSKDDLLNRTNPCCVYKTCSTKFYSSLLYTWFNFTNVEPCNSSEVLQQNICKNVSICIGNDIIYKNYKDWVNAGITSMKDIFDTTNCSFMKREELERMYNINISIMKYNQIISAIPREWKRLLQTPLLTNVGSGNQIPYKCFSNIQTLKNSQIYKYFVTQKIITPVSQNKWVEYYPFLEHVDWKKIYVLCFKIVKDMYIQTMQFKILHRVYNCNYNLFTWGISQTQSCESCQGVDNLEHYFYYCQDVKSFWENVSEWLAVTMNINKTFTVLEVLLGLINLNPKFFYMVNLVVLLGKQFTSRCKRNKKLILFIAYLDLIKETLVVMEQSANIKDENESFMEKFGLLKCVIRGSITAQTIV